MKLTAILRPLIVSALCMALAMPEMAAQRHNGAERQRSERSRSDNRSGRDDSCSRPGRSDRKKNRGDRDNSGRRPGRDEGKRPGGQQRPPRPENPRPSNPGRPDRPNPGHHGPGNRPDHGRPQPPRPPRPPQPPRPPHPGHAGYHRPPSMRPPMRPMRPPMRPYARPVRPPYWAPAMHGPSFGQILGVAIGTAVTATVDRLLSLGYYVDGYDPDAVYLRDVNQWGYAWPYATMYYNNGCLTASQLIYSTPMADPGRYNNLYAGFCNAYGMPASTVQVAGGYTSTWFGPGQGYVELTYRRMNAAGGSMRFFTTVQFGR